MKHPPNSAQSPNLRRTLLRRLPVLLTLPLLLLLPSACTTAPTSGASTSASSGNSGWLRPQVYPSGERRPYWRIGLGSRRIESLSGVQVRGDGSRVYTFTCRAQPPLYVWDRISSQYNSPAVASQYSNFWTYATLDIENMAFLESIHNQLVKVLPKPRNPEHDALLRKLYDAILDARRAFANEAN